VAVTGFVSTTKTREGYDSLLARDQLEVLRGAFEWLKPQHFYATFVTILCKQDEREPERPGAWNRRLVAYHMNRMQRDMRKKFDRRNLTVKMRQGGSTTHHIIDRLYMPTILNPGVASLLVSQTKAYGARHFAILRRVHRHFGRTDLFLMRRLNIDADLFHRNVLHTQYSARHEIVFDFLDSGILVDTAENEEVGAGLTLHHVVATEVAHWPGNPEETLANLKEAIVPRGTLDIESTPNGMGGYFFEEWQRAKQWPNSEFCPHFYPWWWNDEYAEPTHLKPEDLKEQEIELMRVANLTLGQVQWRRTKQVALRHNFPEKYPEDDTSCFLTSGRAFFDQRILRDLAIWLQGVPPLEVHGNGDYLVYRRRVPGRRYIIGADPAEGRLVSTDSPDFSAAVVIDRDTGEEMASYRGRVPPEEFAYELADIGRDYNDALIAVERNVGGSVIITLERECLYPNVYYHRDWNKERKKVIPVAGLPMNRLTRPVALNLLRRFVDDAPEMIRDLRFVGEALTFTRDEKGKPVAQPGAHDDTVFARALAYYAREVDLGHRDPVFAGAEEYGEEDESERPA